MGISSVKENPSFCVKYIENYILWEYPSNSLLIFSMNFFLSALVKKKKKRKKKLKVIFLIF